MLGELEQGCDVELDLIAVGFVDSSALRMFVVAERRAGELGVRFAILEPLPAQLRRVLEVTGLLARLPITPAIAGPEV